MEVVMTNQLLVKLHVRAPESAGRSVSRCAVRLGMRGLIAMVLFSLAPIWARSQQAHVLWSDEKALVTQIELSPGQTCSLTKDNAGDVWIAIDPVVLVTKKDGFQSGKRVRAGEAAIVGSGEELQFRVRAICMLASLLLNRKRHIKNSQLDHSF